MQKPSLDTVNGQLFSTVLVRREFLDLSAIISVHKDWPQPLEVWTEPGSWHGPQQYQLEMGGDLTSVVLVFPCVAVPQELAAYKQKALHIEAVTTKHRRRTLNVNPGLAAPEGVIVASHKGKPHRIRISSGVWGQWVLIADATGRLHPYPPIFTEYTNPHRVEAFETLCRSVKQLGNRAA